MEEVITLHKNGRSKKNVLILVDCLNQHFAMHFITKISEIEVILTSILSDQNHNDRLKLK